MATDFVAMPDWFSSENVGPGFAVADLNGDGRPELVVLMVDNPPGQSAAYYRAGRDLDQAGTASGGWGPWQHIAVADLDGDGLDSTLVT